MLSSAVVQLRDRNDWILVDGGNKKGCEKITAFKEIVWWILSGVLRSRS